MGDDLDANVATAERLVRDAAAQGAQLILLPELFEGPYFCKDMKPEHFDRAHEVDGHPTVGKLAALAAELCVVLPVSIYERANRATYNSVVIVDADGSVLGTYRKSHIPDGPGYTEKYYFNPGDTGFKVWRRRSAWWEPASAGTSGSPSRRAAWRCSAPTCCATRRRSAASLLIRVGIRAGTGGASCRGTPEPT